MSLLITDSVQERDFLQHLYDQLPRTVARRVRLTCQSDAYHVSVKVSCTDIDTGRVYDCAFTGEVLPQDYVALLSALVSG